MEYMINRNGNNEHMTPEEILEIEELTAQANRTPTPSTPEQEIAELKAQLSSMEAAYVRGVNEA